MVDQKLSLTEGNLVSPHRDGRNGQESENGTLTAIHNALKDPSHISTKQILPRFSVLLPLAWK